MLIFVGVNEVGDKKMGEINRIWRKILVYSFVFLFFCEKIVRIILNLKKRVWREIKLRVEK